MFVNYEKPLPQTYTNQCIDLRNKELNIFEYLVETLLKEKNETQGGALSPIAYTEDGNVSSICGTSGFSGI
jgi:hypothetical protein